MHLTNNVPGPHKADAKSAGTEAAGAPEDEITETMVDASLRVMEDYYLGDGRYSVARDEMRTILKAAVVARHEKIFGT